MSDNTTYEWNVFAIDNFGLETENTQVLSYYNQC